MFKTAKKCILALVILALIFLSTYSILDACYAEANCGVSCSLDCGGTEHCTAFPEYATCVCGNVHKTVKCPFKR